MSKWVVDQRVQLKAGGAHGTIWGCNMRGQLFVIWDDAPTQTFRVLKKDLRKVAPETDPDKHIASLDNGREWPQAESE